MHKSWVWWAKFLGAIVLPFLIALGIDFGAEMLVPGKLKIEHWRDASSFIFIAGAIQVVFLLARSGFDSIVRSALGLAALTVLLFAALIVRMHKSCGDESEFIGSIEKPEMVAQCE